MLPHNPTSPDVNDYRYVASSDDELFGSDLMVLCYCLT